MNLTLIAAFSKNNVIGIESRIPWKISDDIKHFKELTIGHPVIMGRKTYESIPEKFRPLPGRKNIVLSRENSFNENIYLAKNMEEALQFTNGNLTYVMGGGEIYNLFLPLSNKMELTKVDKNFEGDSFFPKIDWNDWNLVNSIEKQTKKGLKYSFLTYERK
ncbi:dihydrofolate reductase [archaeon]|jgi:dihydrofolate reductase|nr:dihydrofolate reductase [archaeon]